jgi:hypothetical protein
MHLFVESSKKPVLGIPFGWNVERANVPQHLRVALATIEDSFGQVRGEVDKG